MQVGRSDLLCPRQQCRWHGSDFPLGPSPGVHDEPLQVRTTGTTMWDEELNFGVQMLGCAVNNWRAARGKWDCPVLPPVSLAPRQAEAGCATNTKHIVNSLRVLHIRASLVDGRDDRLYWKNWNSHIVLARFVGVRTSNGRGIPLPTRLSWTAKFSLENRRNNEGV